MNWLDIRVFNKVAETTSLTRAGHELSLSRSAISKRITRLEQQLGTPLFYRSSRRIGLTAAGERFYSHTVRLERDMLLAGDAARDARSSPYGILSFTMPTSLGASLTPLLIRQFRTEWPELQIKANLDDRYLDILAEGYDVGIRFSKRPDGPNLAFHELARTPEVLVASPGYLKQHGQPRHVSELRDHQCLSSFAHKATWRFVGVDGSVEVSLNMLTSMNNEVALILAACLDGGILKTPRLLVESELRQGRLKVILGKFQSHFDYGVFAVYPDRDPPARVRVFLEFIEEWLPRLGEIDRWNPLGVTRS